MKIFIAPVKVLTNAVHEEHVHPQQKTFENVDTFN